MWTDELPCQIHLPVCLWIMDAHSRAPKKNTSHGNEVLPQDTMLPNEEVRAKIQQAIGPHEDLLTIVKRHKLQDPAGNRTTRRSPDHCNETQTAVVWSCLPFIRSGQNHLARHSERGKKTRQTEEKVGRLNQGMDRPRVHQVPEGSGDHRKMEEGGCEVICGAPTNRKATG